MTKVQLIKSRSLYEVKWNVEDFLNRANGIQILDITWIHADSYWHCFITYFEVDSTDD